MTEPPSLFEQDPGEAAWPVSRVTRTASQLIARQFGPLWVQGEISELKQYQSGHWYFTLRDDEAQLRCVMWRDEARRVRLTPEEGTTLFAFGRPTLWAERGEFRLTVSQLIPTAGLGLAQAVIEETKATLNQEGLLDPARKRPLPALAMGVAVVTSPDGAALHDIISVARKRWPAARVVVVGARVQGAGAEVEVVQALQLVNRLEGIDVCIVGRGGGAREDLSVFNTERVCRALAAVAVPTISAVGHETDISLSDLVADVRAPTPSAAAELALEDQADIQRRTDGYASQLSALLRRRTRLLAERLGRSEDRLHGAIRRAVTSRTQLLERLGAQLDALSPLRVLERGYGVARSLDGRVLSRQHDFPPTLPFRLRVRDGDVAARVDDA